MYDVIIIGAGVSGASCARELSRYGGKMCVLEKNEDVCTGTSKANSGLVHAGYDAEHGTLMAQLNVQGNLMMPTLAKELEIPFSRIGSFVVATSEDGITKLEYLHKNGIANGVKGLEIITDRNRIFQMEPELSDETKAVLYAPSAGIICPFELNLAMAEHAKMNGVEFYFNTEVEGLERKEYGWEIHTNNGLYQTKYIVNATGIYADVFHNMVSERKIQITPRKGEYLLLDKSAGNHVNHVIFALPTNLGKGVLVTPTIHGNILIGPTALDVDEKENVTMTRGGIETLNEKAGLNVKNLPLKQVITSFAGLRAHEEGHEFIIEELEDAPGFIDCAGIESPGLTSSPAIGRRVANILQDRLNLSEKEDYIVSRKGFTRVEDMSKEEKQELIKKDATYANIICRCEMISEGEILEAIHRPLGAKSLDGIKRRVRATSGRCQGGFCSPKIMEILSRELGVDIKDVTKAGGESKLIVGINKKI